MNFELESILKDGISLESIGVNNWGFSKNQAIQILDVLDKLNIPVFGGDVFELEKENIRCNYDNWFCERLNNESDENYKSRCISEAKKYIMNYRSKSSGKILFTLVFELGNVSNCHF
jgi:hypothetical protein